MVFFHQRWVSVLVGLHVMLPAEGQGLHADVVDLVPVPAHAHPVDVVQFSGPPAHRADLPHGAGVDVSGHVPGDLRQVLPGGDAMFHAKLDQKIDVQAGGGHVAIGEGETLDGLCGQFVHAVNQKLALQVSVEHFPVARAQIAAGGGDIALQGPCMAALLRADLALIVP